MVIKLTARSTVTDTVVRRSDGTTRPVRTEDDYLFGREAYDLVSRHPFRWNAAHKDTFLEYVEENSHKPRIDNGNHKVLYERLDLDGFEGIENCLGQDVQDLINKKVMDQLKKIDREWRRDNPNPVTIKSSAASAPAPASTAAAFVPAADIEPVVKPAAVKSGVKPVAKPVVKPVVKNVVKSVIKPEPDVGITIKSEPDIEVDSRLPVEIGPSPLSQPLTRPDIRPTSKSTLTERSSIKPGAKSSVRSIHNIKITPARPSPPQVFKFPTPPSVRSSDSNKKKKNTAAGKLNLNLPLDTGSENSKDSTTSKAASTKSVNDGHKSPPARSIPCDPENQDRKRPSKYMAWSDILSRYGNELGLSTSPDPMPPLVRASSPSTREPTIAPARADEMFNWAAHGHQFSKDLEAFLGRSETGLILERLELLQERLDDLDFCCRFSHYQDGKDI